MTDIKTANEYFNKFNMNLIKEKIHNIKSELRNCIKLIFTDENKFDSLIFLEWYNKVKRFSFFKQYDFLNESLNHNKKMYTYCAFIVESIDYIYEEWKNKKNPEDFKVMITICLTDYLLDYKASYYTNFNSTNNELKYIYYKDKYFKKGIPISKNEVFNENNTIHMTALLESIMDIVSTDIEYNIKKYISDLSSRIFSTEELELIEKKIEVLSNNDKVLYSINLGVSRQIAVSISTDEYNSCYYDSGNNFYSADEIIDKLIDKLETGNYGKRYIALYLKEKFKENE